MYLWVAYDEDGLPAAVYDTASELAQHFHVTPWTVYYWLKQGSPKIARIRDEKYEHEEVTTEAPKT